MKKSGSAALNSNGLLATNVSRARRAVEPESIFLFVMNLVLWSSFVKISATCFSPLICLLSLVIRLFRKPFVSDVYVLRSLLSGFVSSNTNRTEIIN